MVDRAMAAAAIEQALAFDEQGEPASRAPTSRNTAVTALGSVVAMIAATSRQAAG